MVFTGLYLSFLEFRIDILGTWKTKPGAPWQGIMVCVCYLRAKSLADSVGVGQKMWGAGKQTHLPAGRKVCMLSL